MPQLTFGKYAGLKLSQVPEDYLQWLIGTRKKDIATYEEELERRALAESANATLVERLVQEGYRAMAKRLHPDTGGSADEFRELKAAHEQLKEILQALRGTK